MAIAVSSLIIGTIIILKKQAPFRTDEGFVFGTVYKRGHTARRRFIK